MVQVEYLKLKEHLGKKFRVFNPEFIYLGYKHLNAVDFKKWIENQNKKFENEERGYSLEFPEEYKAKYENLCTAEILEGEDEDGVYPYYDVDNCEMCALGVRKKKWGAVGLQSFDDGKIYLLATALNVKNYDLFKKLYDLDPGKRTAILFSVDKEKSSNSQLPPSHYLTIMDGLEPHVFSEKDHKRLNKIIEELDDEFKQEFRNKFEKITTPYIYDPSDKPKKRPGAPPLRFKNNKSEEEVSEEVPIE